MKKINRREFLKLSSGALIGWQLYGHKKLYRHTPLDDLQILPPPSPLGRVASRWLQALRSGPSKDADLIEWKTLDEILPLHAMVRGDAPWPSNPYWFETDEGFMHSGYVQPVSDTPEETIIKQVHGRGFWSEVCVPFVRTQATPGGENGYGKKIYYGTIYRVIDAVTAEDGEWWYQLQDGITWSPGPYVPAVTLHPLSAADLAPIEAVMPDPRLTRMPATDREKVQRRALKWIKIDLRKQILTCFEGNHAVLKTKVASGASKTPTARGEFTVLYKRHTQRMIGEDEDGGNAYDLAGVPFPVYLTFTGVAIHGTYWHHDYGRPQSHGCINVPNPMAKWIFRWVDPVVSSEDNLQTAEPGKGTHVLVV